MEKTSKHKKNILGNKGDINNAKKCLINYKCINCNKIYQSRNGLWKHKKICIISNSKDNINHEEDEKNNILNLTNIVLEVVKNNSELVKQNQELQTQLVKTCNINNSNNTINSNNKTFNL